MLGGTCEVRGRRRRQGNMWWLKDCRCVINDLCTVIAMIIAQDSSVSTVHWAGEQLWTGNVRVPAIEENLCFVHVFSFLFFFGGIKSLTCASVCAYRFVPNVSCAGSGFICSRRYWKWIPWAIWIQLIQLNTVNNWSDSETEPCHMGAVTSPLGENLSPVQLDCPGLFVPQSAHCIWLPPVKDTKQEHGRRMGGYSGIVVLSQSAQWQQSHWSPGPWKLMRLSHAQRGLQICTQSDLISRFGKRKERLVPVSPCIPFSQSVFGPYYSAVRHLMLQRTIPFARPPCEPDGLSVGRFSSWPWNNVEIGAIFDPGLGGYLDCNI